VQSLGEILVRVGLGNIVELRIGLNSYIWEKVEGGETQSGLLDSWLGAKINLFQGKKAIPETAVIIGATLPTGSEVFRRDKAQPSAVLAVGWDLSQRFSLGANLGIENLYSPSEGKHFDSEFASVALGFGATDALGFFLEWFGLTREELDGPNISYVDGGATYLLNNDFQLDLYGGLGQNGRDPDFFVGTGFAKRW
jgi:hypothetical protein